MSVLRVSAILRASWIPLLWLANLPGAIANGWSCGFCRIPVLEQYPTRHVVAMLVVTAIETAFLYFVLEPRTLKISHWKRYLRGLGIVLAAALIETMTSVTDMPGYYYINTQYLGIWLLILTGLLAVAAIHAILARRMPTVRNAPPN